MVNFVRVAQTSDIPAGEGRSFEVEGKMIAVFNVNDTFYAIDNVCPHRGGPLGEGYLENKTVTCPWHGWQFDVTCGKSTVNPAAAVASLPVKMEGSEIFVGL
ncbi:MAG: non-heme iron oxygenase ferredoxin subunit [Candidatus Omnitrophica bacterium]|nr:non-heme iron oxygenase ferredoxin subunit [Candidatus Omnitrophota bacterium]